MIALLGTGIMGAPMARNMAAAGLEVTAWNRSREKAEPLAEDGVTVADSVDGAVGAADLVITMLSAGDAVAAVAETALPAMRDDAIWVQSSTVGLEATERLAGAAADAGVTFVDAPVLGTKQPAENGELIVLASGPEGAREPCAPAFDAIGAKTVWLGEAGAGSRMKLVVNNWLLTLTAGLAESVALAEELGLDPADFLSTIRGGPMGPAYADLKGKAMIERGFEPASFPLSLAAKDAGLVLDAAEAEDLDLSVARAVAERFRAAEDQGHGDADMAAAYRAVRPEG